MMPFEGDPEAFFLRERTTRLTSVPRNMPVQRAHSGRYSVTERDGVAFDLVANRIAHRACFSINRWRGEHPPDGDERDHQHQ